MSGGRRHRSGSVADLDDPALVCAVRAAEETAAGFDAVADDLAAAVLAHRRHGVDGALEAVEGVGHLIHDHLEGLVVVVPADFTPSHGASQGSSCPQTYKPL